MENDKKIRKRIFMKALSTVKAVNEVDSVLDEIGINLDFDNTEKPVGRAMGNLLTTPKEVVCDALGLTLKTEKGYCTGAYKGQLLPIEVEVYYPDSDDENTAIPFSITFEGMWDLLDLAAKDHYMMALQSWKSRSVQLMRKSQPPKRKSKKQNLSSETCRAECPLPISRKRLAIDFRKDYSMRW